MAALDRQKLFRYPLQLDRSPITSTPRNGDFVLISLNPPLSVAHLDADAKAEAASLSPGTYCAVIVDVTGLPLRFNHTNEYFVKLVRHKPHQDRTHDDVRFKLPPEFADRYSISIHSHNRTHTPDGDRPQALRPVASFPLSDCELDLSTAGICVRVTTDRKDCTQVLQLPLSEIQRLRPSQYEATRDRRMLQTSGEIPPEFDPRPELDILRQRFPIANEQSNGSDDGSDDSDDSGNDSGSDSGSSDNPGNDWDACLVLSVALDCSVFLNIPVVDVSYDLAEIESPRDPSHFLRERWELYQIVERATQRMRQASASAQAVADDKQ